MRLGAVRDEVLQWVEEEGKAGCFADPTASAKGAGRAGLLLSPLGRQSPIYVTPGTGAPVSLTSDDLRGS